jgi:hypothetical protein
MRVGHPAGLQDGPQGRIVNSLVMGATRRHTAQTDLAVKGGTVSVDCIEEVSETEAPRTPEWQSRKCLLLSKPGGPPSLEASGSPKGSHRGRSLPLHCRRRCAAGDQRWRRPVAPDPGNQSGRCAGRQISRYLSPTLKQRNTYSVHAAVHDVLLVHVRETLRDVGDLTHVSIRLNNGEKLRASYQLKTVNVRLISQVLHDISPGKMGRYRGMHLVQADFEAVGWHDILVIEREEGARALEKCLRRNSEHDLVEFTEVSDLPR